MTAQRLRLAVKSRQHDRIAFRAEPDRSVASGPRLVGGAGARPGAGGGRALPAADRGYRRHALAAGACPGIIDDMAWLGPDLGRAGGVPVGAGAAVCRGARAAACAAPAPIAASAPAPISRRRSRHRGAPARRRHAAAASCRVPSPPRREIAARLEAGEAFAWRLDMAAASARASRADLARRDRRRADRDSRKRRRCRARGARMRPPAITSRSSSTMRRRASPTSCAGATCSRRRTSTACSRRCSACRRRSIATIALLTDANGDRLAKRHGAPTLADLRSDRSRRPSARRRPARRHASHWLMPSA